MCGLEVMKCYAQSGVDEAVAGQCDALGWLEGEGRKGACGMDSCHPRPRDISQLQSTTSRVLISKTDRSWFG